MTTPRELTPLAFIQTALGQARFKKTVTLTQITQVMKSWKAIVRMNDKGLFIVVLAELINYQFQMFSSRMRAFYNEVYPPVKVIRKKRDGQQTRAIRRRRKVDQSNHLSGQQINLQELANKAISEASSQLQLQQQMRLQQIEKQKSQKSGDDSQKIPSEEVIKVDFQRQLQKLDQEEMMENMQAGIIPDQNTNTVTNSSSQSTSNVNLIPKLQEKLRILGGDVSFEGKRTVARRRTGAAGATVRRRPQKIDTSLEFLRTQTLDLSQIPQRLLQQKRRAFELKKQSQDFQIQLNDLTIGIKEKLFSVQNLRRLKNFHKKERQPEQYNNFEAEPIDFSITQSHLQTSFSLNPSTFTNNLNEQSDFNKITIEQFDSNIFRDEKVTTLKKLKQRTGRPKEQIFMKALWMAQRGQIKISQQNPEQFGQISITILNR